MGRALHRNLPPLHRWHQNPLFHPEVQTADTNLKVKGTDSVLHTPKRIFHLARICYIYMVGIGINFYSYMTLRAGHTRQQRQRQRQRQKQKQRQRRKQRRRRRRRHIFE